MLTTKQVDAVKSEVQGGLCVDNAARLWLTCSHVVALQCAICHIRCNRGEYCAEQDCTEEEYLVKEPLSLKLRTDGSGCSNEEVTLSTWSIACDRA